MNKEIKSIEEALLLRFGQMVKENVELEQRVRQLTGDYNDVVRQMQGQGKRKDEAPATRTIGQIRDLFDKKRLALENEEMYKYVKAIDSFIKDKQLYMPKGKSCPFVEGHPDASSTSCLECDSCLRVIDDLGVVCRQVLYGVKTYFANPCPPHQTNS